MTRTKAGWFGGVAAIATLVAASVVSCRAGDHDRSVPTASDATATTDTTNASRDSTKWALAPAAATPAGSVAVREDFEFGELGQLPSGFTAATTIGDVRASSTPTMLAGGFTPHATPATWAVVEDADAPSGRRVLKLVETKNRDEIFNLLLRDELAPADVALAVKIRPDSGRDDRGGGLVWRAQDAANFYLCRWNPLEKNLRVYCVVAGHRLQLRTVELVTDPAAWHALAVTMRGRVVDVAFDGRHVTDCADTTFPNAGRVGLWTRGDAASSFDEFEVAAATPDR